MRKTQSTRPRYGVWPLFAGTLLIASVAAFVMVALQLGEVKEPPGSPEARPETPDVDPSNHQAVSAERAPVASSPIRLTSISIRAAGLPDSESPWVPLAVENDQGEVILAKMVPSPLGIVTEKVVLPPGETVRVRIGPGTLESNGCAHNLCRVESQWSSSARDSSNLVEFDLGVRLSGRVRRLAPMWGGALSLEYSEGGSLGLTAAATGNFSVHGAASGEARLRFLNAWPADYPAILIHGEDPTETIVLPCADNLEFRLPRECCDVVFLRGGEPIAKPYQPGLLGDRWGGKLASPCICIPALADSMPLISLATNSGFYTADLRRRRPSDGTIVVDIDGGGSLRVDMIDNTYNEWKVAILPESEDFPAWSGRGILRSRSDGCWMFEDINPGRYKLYAYDPATSRRHFHNALVDIAAGVDTRLLVDPRPVVLHLKPDATWGAVDASVRPAWIRWQHTVARVDPDSGVATMTVSGMNAAESSVTLGLRYEARLAGESRVTCSVAWRGADAYATYSVPTGPAARVRVTPRFGGNVRVDALSRPYGFDEWNRFRVQPQDGWFNIAADFWRDDGILLIEEHVTGVPEPLLRGWVGTRSLSGELTFSVDGRWVDVEIVGGRTVEDVAVKPAALLSPKSMLPAYWTRVRNGDRVWLPDDAAGVILPTKWGRYEFRDLRAIGAKLTIPIESRR